ncbi:endonuclease [Bifidobacterium dolichotidis]|uniref:UPF0102 protein D2E26_0379 n=1 Tax=Bifidobacterium dolichotidis TaxID=2306976 RepID=A0A430FSF7_9BIFI|nr:YraN family protein [Bifidobacterium dolichotidis]RSX55816.1 endonuclease [Bifidobacterium dolichotidis]
MNTQLVQPQEATLEQCRSMLVSPELSARHLGCWGEAAAARWLEHHGWHILDHNWHSRFGELDLVARNEHNELAFIEVKTRRGLMFGSPIEAVGIHKQRNLRRAALQWLLDPEHRIPHGQIRFDVVGVLIQAPRIRFTHVPYAF